MYPSLYLQSSRKMLKVGLSDGGREGSEFKVKFTVKDSFSSGGLLCNNAPGQLHSVLRLLNSGETNIIKCRHL